MCSETAEKADDYKEFYVQIGERLRLAAHADSANRSNAVELSRFHPSGSTPSM